jgi:hypothetical protein
MQTTEQHSGVLFINRFSFLFVFVFNEITIEPSLSFKIIHCIYKDFLGNFHKQKKYQLQTLSEFQQPLFLHTRATKNRSLQI